MDPDEAKSVANFLIADFENEIQTTQRVLAAVPVDRLDYRPDAKAKTGLGLVRHIALEDEWFLNCIANGEFTQPPDDSDACGIMNPSDAVARYKEPSRMAVIVAPSTIGSSWSSSGSHRRQAQTSFQISESFAS